MKTPPHNGDDDRLLDAILNDEDWSALDTTLRDQALISLRHACRVRRLQHWTAMTAGVAVALGAAVWFLCPSPAITNRPPVASRPIASAATEPTVIIRNFKPEELLALFPEGSCVIAEVNGRPRLYVLDEKLAAQGFDRNVAVLYAHQ